LRDLLRVRIADVRIVPAGPGERSTGLIAYVGLRVGELFVDGLRVVRTRDGQVRVLFPTRVDRRRTRHHVVRPARDDVRQAIEDRILAEVRREGLIP